MIEFNRFLFAQVSKYEYIILRKQESTLLEYLLLFLDDNVWMHWKIICGDGEANINPATAPDSIPSPTKPESTKWIEFKSKKAIMMFNSFCYVFQGTDFIGFKWCFFVIWRIHEILNWKTNRNIILTKDIRDKLILQKSELTNGKGFMSRAASRY